LDPTYLRWLVENGFFGDDKKYKSNAAVREYIQRHVGGSKPRETGT